MALDAGSEINLTAEELEVVGKRPRAGAGKVLADGTAKEQDQDDGRGDPERAVQIGIALKNIEEVYAREERGPAAREDC